MQLALGLLTAGGGAAASGAGVAATVGSGISAASILQGVTGLFSAVSAMSAANAQANSLNDQAFQADLEATRENAAGNQRQTSIKREALRIMGDNVSKYAASGIDISSGVAAETNSDLERVAAEEVTIDRADADARSSMRRLQSAGLRRQAKDTRRGGMFQALGIGMQTGLSFMKRG
jgi:hypothetical protein